MRRVGLEISLAGAALQEVRRAWLHDSEKQGMTDLTKDVAKLIDPDAAWDASCIDSACMARQANAMVQAEDIIACVRTHDAAAPDHIRQPSNMLKHDVRWKRVPREPTEEMINACRGPGPGDWMVQGVKAAALRKTWQTMFDAAPEEPPPT